MKNLLHYKSQKQMSESLLTAGFLSLSGGLQDAYTYISRGKVFANAQTGNIVLLSQHLFAGDFHSLMHYLVPVCFFALGVMAAELTREHFQAARKLHWRQLVLLIEIFLLFLVGFLPESLNLVANAMVSFACAMQVQAFRKVNSYAFASTMCIGNIRSGMEALCAYHLTRNKKLLYKSFHYFGVIFLFSVGAGLGSRLIGPLSLHTIWISCALLLVSFLLMFIKEEIEEHPEIRQEEAKIQEDLKDIRKEVSQVNSVIRQDIESSHKK